LTGLPLRYGLEEEFQRCRAQALRRSELTILMLLDVDHFKRVNDVHGHATGDLALQHIANLLRSHCRTDEPLFRFGGEEFIALVQVPYREMAFGAADRLLQVLRDNPLRLPDGHMLSLRVSAGLAEVRHEESLAQALARADRSLYAAKSGGRDNWKWLTDEPRNL
jgi:diguanylate cyclase (GGDEF)-like protein